MKPTEDRLYIAAPLPGMNDVAHVLRRDNGNAYARVATLTQQMHGTWITTLDEPSWFLGRLPHDFDPTTTWTEAAEQLAAWGHHKVDTDSEYPTHVSTISE
ncbi:hypothetical protein [Clavibacter michiganensis]|nr:hypothetical protein [Clavibacter michiganensis]